MPDVMTKSAFAAHRGVMTSAVSNWIARGKLSGPALTADGRIAVEEAERQLGRTVDPGRGAPPAPTATPRPVAGTEANEQVEQLADLRLRSEKLKLEKQERAAEEEKLAAAQRRGELMHVDEARRIWAAELDELLAAVEVFVVELPTALGLGRDAVDTARRAWRDFRRRRSEQAEAKVDRAA